MRFSIAISALLSLTATVVSADHITLKKKHSGIRNTKGVNGSKFLAERDGGSRFTYYQDGLGACGKTNKPGDFIVALNSAQFDGGSHCFESITISIDGKSTEAMIVDECPGCPPGGLDFSEGLFDFFGSESEGVLYGSWNYGGAPAAPTTSSTPPPPPPTTSSEKPKPTTSSTPPPPPPPTTTSKAHKTTSTSTTSSTPIPTSTKHSTTHSHTSSKPAPPPTSTPSSTPLPTSTSSSLPAVETAGAISTDMANKSNVYKLTEAFLGLSAVLVDAHSTI